MAGSSIPQARGDQRKVQGRDPIYTGSSSRDTRPMTSLPAWSAWRADSPSSAFTIGIEEEFMLLDPRDWSLAFRSDEVIAGLSQSYAIA